MTRPKTQILPHSKNPPDAAELGLDVDGLLLAMVRAAGHRRIQAQSAASGERVIRKSGAGRLAVRDRRDGGSGLDLNVGWLGATGRGRGGVID